MSKPITSLTISAKEIASKLISGIDVIDPFSLKTIHVNGIWDTGATRSVITQHTAHALGLISVGQRTVRGVHGVKNVNVYLATIHLDDTDIEITEQVTECDELSSDGSIGALIGMNIISLGDFAISNFQGKTKFTFRSPSKAHVDYTHEYIKL